ncbi:MAG TPA: TagF domain-containing protein, partial [Phycisphaerae bacterium]|nr:TagF domain-containing protein [Phycisphaerae bacterium]
MPSLGQLISGFFAPRDLPLRAYGKVPFAAEYRRLNAGGPAASAFCRWLDDGRAAWMQHSDQPAVAPTRLFVRPVPRGDFVAAHIRGSHDSLGRPFPLAFFVTIPRAAVGDDPLAAWLIAPRLNQQLAVQFDELAVVEGADGFQAA